MLNVLVLVLGAVVLLATGATLLGRRRWESETRRLRARLDAARRPVRPPFVDFGELEGLPGPVQRFFRTALAEGAPMVAGVRIRHVGTFDMSETAPRWKSFTSDQKVVMQRPGFDWNARIAMAPGMSVHVHDAYVAGEGLLHAAFSGLISLANAGGSDDMAEGQLMRFFAETAWYPTALLPGQGVQWEPVDDRSSRAILTDGGRTVTLLFTFNEAALIESVRAEARGRTVGGKVVPTPWQGRFWDYAERDGMQAPLEGEVAWLTPTGARPYWRGRITEVTFTFETTGD